MIILMSRQTDTVTFQPAPDVEKILSRFDTPRGLQSKIINEAIRQNYAKAEMRIIQAQRAELDDKLRAIKARTRKPQR